MLPKNELLSMQSMLHVVAFLSSVVYRKEKENIVGMKINLELCVYWFHYSLRICYDVKCLRFPYKQTDRTIITLILFNRTTLYIQVKKADK